MHDYPQITCRAASDHPLFIEDLAEINFFFNKIIKKSKSAKNRNQAREIKEATINGLFITYSCIYEEGQEEIEATRHSIEEVQ